MYRFMSHTKFNAPPFSIFFLTLYTSLNVVFKLDYHYYEQYIRFTFDLIQI